MGVLYEDQTFEIFDLNTNLDTPIYYGDLSEYNLNIIDFTSIISSENQKALSSYYLLFANKDQRVFRMGPFFFPRIYINKDIINQIELLSNTSSLYETIYTYVNQMEGKI